MELCLLRNCPGFHFIATSFFARKAAAPLPPGAPKKIFQVHVKNGYYFGIGTSLCW